MTDSELVPLTDHPDHCAETPNDDDAILAPVPAFPQADGCNGRYGDVILPFTILRRLDCT
jgi:hypothetical protein